MTPCPPDITQYPELLRIVELIGSENPLQRKRILNFLAQQNGGYFEFAEELSRKLNHSILCSDTERLTAARAYNHTCMEILREQIRFRKAGTYLIQDAEVAEQTVYSQKERMRAYIVGLLLSYLFWPNHYEMFQFYLDYLREIEVGQCLEVGAGHGLFTAEMLRKFPAAVLEVIDISTTSIGVAGEILEAFGIDRSRIQFTHADFMNAPLAAASYDCIVMGEVLEHVNDALGFLRKTAYYLRPNGTVFLTTCVNCPAPDHVYHFHTVEEIRELIRSAGLRIRKEQALAAEAVPEELWQKELVTINYSAVLSAKETT
ncbi:MAG TPA: class I SAM-dependent methyltransferase [Terriglobales bacterium]|nr:class I SAM-dependent methyltransferase [Terriglobales bacterium]